MEFIGKKTSSKIKMENAIKPKKTKSKKDLTIKGPWLYREDLLLKKWVEENGPTKWCECAKTIPGRNAKQCNQHWNICLKPNLTVGHWTSEEIFLIMLFYKKYNGSWKKMIPIFNSRSENSIKNIFFSQLRKNVKSYKNKDYQNENAGLAYLLQFYDIVFEKVKIKFLKDSPMTEKELEEYIKNIEILLENKQNGQKYIDLNKIEKPKHNSIKIESNNKIKIMNERDIKTKECEIKDKKEKDNKKKTNNNAIEINTKNKIEKEEKIYKKKRYI